MDLRNKGERMYQNIVYGISNAFPVMGKVKSVHGVLNMNTYMEEYVGHELGDAYRKLAYDRVINGRDGVTGLEKVVKEVFETTPIIMDDLPPLETNIIYNDRFTGDIIDSIVRGFGNDLFTRDVIHGYKSLYRFDGSCTLYYSISLLDHRDEEEYRKRLADQSANVLFTSGLKLHHFLDIIVTSSQMVDATKPAHYYHSNVIQNGGIK